MELCENFQYERKGARLIMSFQVSPFYRWSERSSGSKSKMIHVFDESARNSMDLDHPLPGVVHVDFSCNWTFMIKVGKTIIAWFFNI